MKPKYYGKAKNINVVKRVPFAWRSWVIVGAIKVCRDGIAFYSRMVAGNVFPEINHYFRVNITQLEIQQCRLLSKFEGMLSHTPKVGSVSVQRVADNIYKLVRIDHIDQELRVGSFTIVHVGTKEECEYARDMFYGN